jgi:hypothetical protein
MSDAGVFLVIFAFIRSPGILRVFESQYFGLGFIRFDQPLFSVLLAIERVQR